jgi:2-polyprenyl-3-methyl-5-hydroxy-6-metoxy-1,4-benzoquinol methylase
MRVDFFKCLNCGNTDVQVSDRNWVCRQCNSEYPLEQGVPVLVRNWNVHKEELEQAKLVKPGWYLEEQPAEQVSPWRHHLKKRRIYVQTEIEKHLASRKLNRVANLLDLGCGDGNHLEYLQNYAEQVYGSDYNLVRLVRSGARNSSATLFLADILDYPAQDNFFDMVFFHHVIEHIPDHSEALKTIYRILKPRGLLVLGTPNEGVWWWRLAYKLQPETLASTDHVHFYTSSTLSELMRDAGFEIKKVKHIGWGPPHWEWDMRIRKYKWVDDAFEFFGRIFIPRQASSLYVLAVKPENGE